jgi:DNA-binding response OmpR family regulator
VSSNHSAPSLQFGSVTLIPDERLVLKDGQPVPLTPKAFDLLAVLAANPGRLLTKEHLMEASPA